MCLVVPAAGLGGGRGGRRRVSYLPQTCRAHVLTGKLQAGPAGVAGTCVRGMRAWGLGRGVGWTKGAVLVLEGAMNVCVLVNLESAKCVPALATFCLCQPKKRRGLGALLEFCVSPPCRCC